MLDDRIFSDDIGSGEQLTLLERTYMAEYLLSRGYLPCEFDRLQPEIADQLYAEARLFAKMRLSDAAIDEKFPWFPRRVICLN